MKPAHLLILLSVAVWGISSPVAKYVLDFMPPQLVLFLRFTLITVILSPYVILNWKKYTIPLKKSSRTNWATLGIVGFLGSIAQIGLIYLGFTYTTSIDGTLLISTSPVLVAFASVMFLKEKLTKNEVMGYVLATMGSLVLIIGPILSTGKLFSGSAFGNSLIIGANFCWAGYVVLSKRLDHGKLAPVFLTWVTFLIGAIGMGIITFSTLPTQIILAHLQLLPPTGYLGIIYIALFAGIIGYVFYQKAIKTINAAEAELFNYLTPLITTPIAFFWLHEPITLKFIISSLLIGLGIYIAEFRPLRPSNRSNPAKKKPRHQGHLR